MHAQTVAARMWLSLAADGGDKKAATLLPDLEKSMTREQIAEAKRRAEAHKAKLKK